MEQSMGSEAVVVVATVVVVVVTAVVVVAESVGAEHAEAARAATARSKTPRPVSETLGGEEFADVRKPPCGREPIVAPGPESASRLEGRRGEPGERAGEGGLPRGPFRPPGLRGRDPV
jgi:hypothetical protein